MIWVVLVIVAVYTTIITLTMLEMKHLHDSEVTWLRQYIEELEAGKRALTESLCRTEGKVYIPPPSSRPLQPPGDGWFDAAPEIRIADDKR